MPLIICAGCGRQRNAAKAPHGVACFNCGAIAPVVVRGAQVSTLLATTDREGVDRKTARRQTYAGLRKWQEVNNFKPGYVGVKFREIFGEWPNGEAGTPSEPMTHELGLWIRRSKSRYAAQRAKAKASSTAESKVRGGRIAMLERVANLMNHRKSPTSSQV